MRKLLFLTGCLFITCAGFSQTKQEGDSIPAYIHIGDIPDFITYKAPDSTAFVKKDLQKGKAVLLMIFSPDCGHCQHVATEILENMSHFKNDKILMITWLPFSDMMSFYKTYKIADYPNVTMAWDPKYFFLPYFHVHTFPKLIAYNKKEKYIKEFEGNIKIEEVWQAMGAK